MNRYRLVKAPATWPDHLEFRVTPAGSEQDYGVGDEFDAEFTPEQEQDHLASGLLELVPRRYKVLDGRVFDTDAGDTFTAPLLVGQANHLLDGGFVELVHDKPVPEKPRTKKTKEV